MYYRAVTAAGTGKKFKKWLFEFIKWLKGQSFTQKGLKVTKKITLEIRDFLEFLTFLWIFQNCMPF